MLMLTINTLDETGVKVGQEMVIKADTSGFEPEIREVSLRSLNGAAVSMPAIDIPGLIKSLGMPGTATVITPPAEAVALPAKATAKASTRTVKAKATAKPAAKKAAKATSPKAAKAKQGDRPYRRMPAEFETVVRDLGRGAKALSERFDAPTGTIYTWLRRIPEDAGKDVGATESADAA